MQQKVEELQNRLNQFTGSTELYEHSISDYKILITEGVKYLADHAGAWWLTDVLLSYQWNPKYSTEEFQTWKLKRGDESSFLVTCENGNKKRIGEQYIHYSDFPLDEITLWLVNGVLMLPSEY